MTGIETIAARKLDQNEGKGKNTQDHQEANCLLFDFYLEKYKELKTELFKSAFNYIVSRNNLAAQPINPA